MLFLILSLPVICAGQQIVEVVHIEKDDGLKDRTVDRVIRDNNGYFILFMLNTIQRYDGKSFETFDISALKSSKREVRDIIKAALLIDGTILLYIPHVDLVFFIPPGENRVLSMPKKGIPLVNQGNLYQLLPSIAQKDQYQIYAEELNEHSDSKLFSPVSITNQVAEIAILNDYTYLQFEDLSIQLIVNDQLKRLPIRGRIIQRSNGIYVFGQDSIYKLLGEHTYLVKKFDTSYHDCTILKLDGKENIIASYTNKARFQEYLLVLDLSDVVHPFPAIIEVSNVFKDIHTDNAFHRWMLVGYNGLHSINLLRNGSQFLLKKETIQKGEFGNIISGVASNQKDEVFFIQETKGAYTYHPNDAIFQPAMEEAQRQGAFQKNAKLYYDKTTNTYASHSFRYDGKSDIYITDTDNETFRKYTVPYKLNDIYRLDEHHILFGGYISKTTTGILGVYDLQNETYTVLRNDFREIRSIYYDSTTVTYWIGTYSGLHVLSSDFSTLAFFSREQNDAQFMAQDHIIMTSRYKSWIIAGSYGGGVYLINPEEHIIYKKMDENNGLNDNTVVGIINDDDDHCWITTFNGISVIDSNLQVIRKIYEHDGLPNREFNSKSITKDENGWIYAGTLNGVSLIDPKIVLNWESSHRLHIQSIVGYDGNNFELLKSGPEISLYSSFDSVVIHYNIPDYHHYPYVQPIIQVKATDELEASVFNDKITLKNFKLGTFEVDILLEGNPRPTYLKIRQHNNFKRAIGIISIVLFIGLIAWFISRQIIKSTKIREEEKTKLNKRIADLRLSSLQSQMNPHFIFNALGSIQYFIQTYDTVKADEFLSNFAMLMRSILESSKSKYITLNEEIKLIKLYVGLEKIRFENLFEYHIETDEKLDLESKIPPMIIQPFVENAINHGLYHLKGRKGILHLTFESTPDHQIKITITDNGIGRQAAAKLRNKNHKSRGMQIVNERLETFNMSKALTVNVTTHDLVEEDRPKGTKVVITVSD
ncbi:MAG: histidine kinase [Saprospiraceae bacterium]|nr:histidine kinase [Saprospiraceae bacterium]